MLWLAVCFRSSANAQNLGIPDNMMKHLIGLTASICLVIAVFTSCDRSGTDSQAAPSSSVRTLTAEQYYDKVHGAWLGGAIGGALGKNLQRWDKEEMKVF